MSRLLFSTYEKGKNSIRYYASLSNQLSFLYNITGLCCPCTCMCLSSVKEEVRKSTYVQVNENNIEYNYPYSCLSPTCSCVIYDNVHKVYFDRAVMEDIDLCETCSLSAVTLSSRTNCKCCVIKNNGDDASCCGMICLPCIEDPWQLMKSIEEIRTTRLQDQNINIEMNQCMTR
jgi:hypothetical protein